jgi:hypothetical protein
MSFRHDPSYQFKVALPDVSMSDWKDPAPYSDAGTMRGLHLASEAVLRLATQTHSAVARGDTVGRQARQNQSLCRTSEDRNECLDRNYQHLDDGRYLRDSLHPRRQPARGAPHQRAATPPGALFNRRVTAISRPVRRRLRLPFASWWLRFGYFRCPFPFGFTDTSTTGAP